MRPCFSTQGVGVLVVAVACVAGGCCCPGYVLHGDWSLGISRRSDCYESSCSAPCTASCGGEHCRGRGGAGHEAGAYHESPEPYGYSYFHPVPTRPAFAPRGLDHDDQHDPTYYDVPANGPALRPVPDEVGSAGSSRQGGGAASPRQPSRSKPGDDSTWVFGVPPHQRAAPERVSRRQALETDRWQGR